MVIIVGGERIHDGVELVVDHEKRRKLLNFEILVKVPCSGRIKCGCSVFSFSGVTRILTTLYGALSARWFCMVIQPFGPLPPYLYTVSII